MLQRVSWMSSNTRENKSGRIVSSFVLFFSAVLRSEWPLSLFLPFWLECHFIFEFLFAFLLIFLRRKNIENQVGRTPQVKWIRETRYKLIYRILLYPNNLNGISISNRFNDHIHFSLSVSLLLHFFRFQIINKYYCTLIIWRVYIPKWTKWLKVLNGKYVKSWLQVSSVDFKRYMHSARDILACRYCHRIRYWWASLTTTVFSVISRFWNLAKVFQNSASKVIKLFRYSCIWWHTEYERNERMFGPLFSIIYALFNPSSSLRFPNRTYAGTYTFQFLTMYSQFKRGLFKFSSVASFPFVKQILRSTYK